MPHGDGRLDVVTMNLELATPVTESFRRYLEERTPTAGA